MPTTAARFYDDCVCSTPPHGENTHDAARYTAKAPHLLYILSTLSLSLSFCLCPLPIKPHPLLSKIKRHISHAARHPSPTTFPHRAHYRKRGVRNGKEKRYKTAVPKAGVGKGKQLTLPMTVYLGSCRQKTHTYAAGPGRVYPCSPPPLRHSIMCRGLMGAFKQLVSSCLLPRENRAGERGRGLMCSYDDKD